MTFDFPAFRFKNSALSMRAIFQFSDEELESLQSNSFKWVEAVTPIAKQMVADETSAELAIAREKSLDSLLSPKERQKLYEVCSGWLFVSRGLKKPPRLCAVGFAPDTVLGRRFRAEIALEK
jgi:hypothetical protein